MHFAIFPLHLSKVLLLPRKSDSRSYEVLHLSRKIILANLQIWCSKMQPLSGNQRPDLLTSLMNMSFVLRLPRKMHLCRSSSNVPLLPSFLEMLQNPHVLLTFEEVHNPLRLPRETTSERPKVVQACSVLYILTSKCALRHNGVHFSTSQLPKVLCTWCVLYILTWKCASRRDGVQLVISHVARWPRTRRFSEPTFGPSRATNHWKNTLFRSFPTFSCTWIFFLLRLSLCWSSFFFLLLFSSLLFSDSSHLCFSFVHIVGSLTSKLPSARVDLQFRCLTCGVCWFNLHIYSPVWLLIKANCFLTIKHIQTWLDRNSPLKLDIFTSSIILNFIINHLDFLQS